MGLITKEMLKQLEQKNGIPSGLLSGQIGQESSGNPRAVSKAGAMGVLQLMPATAKELGVTNPFDEVQNVTAGAKYLGQQIKAFGDVEKGLQAYNWGGGNMRSYLRTGLGANGQAMPIETQQYAGKVMGKSNYDPLDEIMKADAAKSKPVAQPANYDPLDEIMKADAAKQAKINQRSWSDVPLEAISNIPSSAASMVGNIAHVVAHPIDTAGDILDVGAGAIANAMPKTMAALDKAFGTEKNTARAAGKASAVGQALKDRYGSTAAIKNTFATDPVGAAADIATLATGGEALAAKVPQMAGAAKVLGKVAQVTNPLNAVAPIVRGTGKVIGNVGKQALGFTTGVGAETIGQAAKAGFEGKKAFIDNANGKVSGSDILGQARDALNNMRYAKSTDYKSGIASTAADTTPLKFDAIDTALNDGMATTRHGNLSTINELDAGKLNELKTVVDAWKNDPSAHTAIGLDALKRRIDAIPVDHVNANAASRIVSQVRGAVKKTIVDQSPEYAKTMGKYEEATALEKEIQQALSLNKKASADTTLRKLQSLARNNVNTSYGHRLELAKALEDAGGTDLMSAISGQAMNTFVPRGLASSVGTTAALGTGAFLTNPALLGMIPLQSPRLVANALYGGGRAAGMAAKAGSKATAPLSKAGLTKSQAKKIALLSNELGKTDSK